MIQKLGQLTLLMAFIFFGNTAFAQQTITLLDKGEPYDCMTAEGGIFWIGHSRRDFNSDYRLEAWSPSGDKIAEMKLSHSLNVIKKHQNGGVIITGINPISRLTQYTSAKLAGRSIQTVTRNIDLGGFINFWVGNIGTQHYFVDQGGNPNDTNLTDPAQTIFSSSGSRATYLSTRVRMPVDGTILARKLYLVSSAGIGATNAGIVEVDPVSQVAKVLHSSATSGYSMIEPVPGTDLLATNARYDNKIVLISRADGRIAREFQTKGYTRSVTAYKNCVIAGNDETNMIEAFDLRSASETPVVSAKVELAAEEFSGLKRIAVDEQTGIVFARSAQACNLMIEPCTENNNRVITFGTEIATSLKAACN